MNIVRSRIPMTGIVLTAGPIVGGSLAAAPLEAQGPTGSDVKKEKKDGGTP